MTIFQRDNFSRSKIVYKTVTRPSFLKEILGSYFNNYKIKKVFQLDRAEINSENYKVILDIGGGNVMAVLLRRYKNLSNFRHVFFYLSFLDKLSEFKFPVSQVLKNLNGGIATQTKNGIFALFDFIDGVYFSPAKDNFVSVARAIARMHQGFEQLDPTFIKKINILSQQTPVYYNQIKRVTIQDFLKIGRIIKKKKKYNSLDISVLRSMPLFIDAVRKIESNKKKMKKLKNKVIHSDLHPHNILMDNKEVKAILDFDAVRISQQARDVACAIYRFGRQFLIERNMVDNHISALAVRLRDLFLTKYNEINILNKEEVAIMPLLVKEEFLKKILFVLKGIYKDDNFIWARDLPKFMAAIEEINYFWPNS